MLSGNVSDTVDDAEVLVGVEVVDVVVVAVETMNFACVLVAVESAVVVVEIAEEVVVEEIAEVVVMIVEMVDTADEVVEVSEVVIADVVVVEAAGGVVEGGVKVDLVEGVAVVMVVGVVIEW